MKRYSSASGHSSMAELNITPLLDLAFVLLIIFVITTPLIEQGINLTPPTSSANPLNLDPTELKTIEVDRTGALRLDGVETTLSELARALASLKEADPKVSVGIRADKDVAYQHVVGVIDLLQRLQISRFGLVTQPDQ